MNNLLNKKIPTIIGLLIITLGIFGTTYLVQNLRPFFTRATTDTELVEEEPPLEIKLPTPTVASPSGKTPGFKTDTPPSGAVNIPKIINPEENESFKDSQPRFSGTAPRGSNVKITIESQGLVETTVQADSLGNWSYRPVSPLTPGEHTITITAPDSNGILRTITKKFRVFAQGSQVAESATPSATPTVKTSPTPTPIPPVAKGGTTPTATPTITAGITVVPTKAPGPIPVTGDSLPLIFLGAIGVITFLVGLALLF